MALVVYDQGTRIQTPVSSLFSQRGVEQLTQLQRARGIPSSEDRVEAPGPRNEEQRRFSQAQRAYQQTEQLSRPAPTLRPLPVAKIMTAPVFTIAAGAAITEAWRLLEEHQVRHLAVLNAEGRLFGVLSEYDLLRRSALVNMDGPTRAQLSIDGAYSTQLIVATPDTEVRQIALTFMERRIGCMPIMDEDELAGIVTRSDLLHLITNEADLSQWA
ncbi:HPP family protein [Motiliproteus sp. SC1-56]|uniref:CBS domain-containing protein n=1 Tax=Motiliproteus sp. SC1-56 TaxID=2799565 RepID=UPI001A8C17A7|nr:CBS domain-containing protein [Motiliproteus sp. SC1-56]